MYREVSYATVARPSKETPREERRCNCYPPEYGYGDFPYIWSELRLQQQLCDGLIHSSDGEVLHVHRVILAAISPYFKALFTNSINGGEPEIFEIHLDISKYIIECILDFAYTGKCLITIDNVQMLLQACDQYEVLGVLQQCCAYLIKELNPKNCLGFMQFARRYFCHDVDSKCRRYVVHNLMSVLRESEEFIHLSVDDVRDILSDDELNVRYEELVFEALTRWISTDPLNRVSHFTSLIDCPRYGLMSFKYFAECVMKSPYVVGDEEIQNYLMPTSLFLSDFDDRTVNDNDQSYDFCRPRIPHEICFAIGGWSAGSPTSFIETYDCRADRWFLCDNTDTKSRAYHGLCTIGHLIYVIGGFDGSEHFNTMRCFNPVTKEWKELACMYQARCYISVCVLAGQIYAIGGFNGRHRMSSAERYTPGTNQWELIPHMHRERSDASAASLNGRVYIVGGFNGVEVLSCGEMFDPSTSQWTYIARMTTARSGVCLVNYRNCLYAIGGFNGFTRLNTAERLNSNFSDDWIEITDMFTPRSNFAAVVLDDMIFVIGGFNGSTTTSYVECYDGDTNEWFDARPINLNRSALSAVVVPGLPNAREYSFVTKVLMYEHGASSEVTGMDYMSG